MNNADCINADALPVSVLHRIDAICTDFERAWLAGHSPRIEDYLEAGAPAARRRLFEELLAVELEFRENAGQVPSAADYAARFRADAVAVERAFAELARRNSQAYSTCSSTGFAEDPPVEFPAAVGSYRVVERLSGGDDAEVFRVVNSQLPGRDLVLKWLRQPLRAGQQQRLLAEGQILARLDDPGLVRLFDVDVFARRPFVVLEWVAGRTLKEAIQHAWPSPREAARLAAMLARTLAVIHRQGVFHGDLSSASILIDAADRPRILDFGLAASQRSDGAERPAADTIVRGQSADVSALGSILYELLTGRPPEAAGTPPDGPQRRVCSRPFRSPRKVNPAVPRSLDRICRRALACDVDQRYGSASECEAALRQWLRRRWFTAAAFAGALTAAALWLAIGTG